MRTNRINIFNRRFNYWYDKNQKIWFAQEVDLDNNQIGDTIDHVDRDTLMVLIGAEATNERTTQASRRTAQGKA